MVVGQNQSEKGEMMKKCILFTAALMMFVCFSVVAFAQSPGAPLAVPDGTGPGLKGPVGPSLSGPPGALIPGMPTGPSSSAPPQEPFGEIYFSAGAVSPDGKAYYVAFDRYLLKYTLPELKLAQKIDLGLPVSPVTPSISITPDGKWIYIIQNGAIVQIEKESLKVKKTEPIRP